MEGCKTCERWTRRPPDKHGPKPWVTRYGFCEPPKGGPPPYWRGLGYTNLMTAETSGVGCKARKAKS